MAVHAWSVLCQRGIVDKQTNQVSLIDVVEQLEVSEVPTEEQIQKGAAIQTNTHLVTMWYRSNFDEPESGSFRIVLLSPSGNESVIYTGKFALSGSSTHRNILFIAGIPFFALGLHKFIIQVQDGDDWKEVGSTVFYVNKKETEKPST